MLDIDYLDYKGGRLNFAVADLTPPWTENPETILFHHGVATDKDIWAAWVPALAGAYRVVRLDVRGYGGSSPTGTDFEWTMAGLVDDTLAVADALGVKRFHMVGESTGGTAAYHTAIHHPDRLLSVTALSASHRGGDIRHVAVWRDFIVEHGMRTWSEMMMERRFYPGAVTRPVWEWFHRVQSESAVESVLGMAEMLMQQNLTADLPRITAPVLILHPDSSPFLPVEIAAEIHSLIEGSEMQVLPYAKHGIACSHAVEGVAALRDFLGRRADQN